MNLQKLVDEEIQKGYSAANASAKVCQDIVLKAIDRSSLSRNVTIKGGVVMRSKTGNARRATQDLDLDFIKYSLADEAIDAFIKKLNCLDGIVIKRVGEIEGLKHQDYSGKSVNILIEDTEENSIKSKIDLGVHNRLNIEQEEYCFDIAYDEEGASLLVNPNEQMFSEKLRSLLKFGPFSTRYKDIFDIYYLKDYVEEEKLAIAMNEYIFNDSVMRENNMNDVLKRLKTTFKDKRYMKELEKTDKKWIEEDVKTILDELLHFFERLDKK